MSSRSSSKRRGDTSLRIKLGSGGSKKGSQPDDETIDLSDDDEVEETNGQDDEDTEESDVEVIPQKKARVSNVNKAAFSMPDVLQSVRLRLRECIVNAITGELSHTHDVAKLMNRVLCCSCGKQVNPMNPGAVRRHPWLKVVTCKKCYKFLKSGTFTHDADGIDEQCRWCGDGGRLYGCDYCNNCFCRSCIKRNLGRSEAARMENEDDSKWKCYLCKPKKLGKLTDDCNKILNYIAQQDKKEKEREERAKLREKEKAESAKKDKDRKREERKKENTPVKISLPAPKPKETIVLDDSPVKQPITISSKKPLKPDIKTGVQSIVRDGNGVTSVVVGPKPKQPVVMPYKPIQPAGNSQFISKMPMTGNIQSFQGRSKLQGVLTAPIQVVNPPINRGLPVLKQPSVPPNDLQALNEGIMPYNVDGMVEKMYTVSQSVNLMLNSIKTDLAIAKLSSNNMYNARHSAAGSLKNGMTIFFNSVRDIFNVQIKASSSPIEIDSKSEVGNTKMSNSMTNNTTTSTPIRNQSDLKKENLDVSHIPISLDDDEENTCSKKDDKKEVKATDDKVVENGTDDSCLVVSSPEENEEEDFVIMEVDDDDDEDVGNQDDDVENQEIEKNKEDHNEQITEKEGEVVSDNEVEIILEQDEDIESSKISKNSQSNKNNEESEKEVIPEKVVSEKGDCANESENGNSNTKKAKKDSSKKKTTEDTELNEDNESKDSKKDENKKSKSDKNKGKHSTETEHEILKEMEDKKENDSSMSDVESEGAEIEVDGKTNKKQGSKKAEKNKQSNKDNSEKDVDVLDEEKEEIYISNTKDSKKSKKTKRDESDSSPIKKHDENENTAAELELLKEMEDEMNENDSAEEENEEPRRSSRTKSKKDAKEHESENEKNESVNRKSSRQKKSKKDESEDDKMEEEMGSKRSSRQKSPLKRSRNGKDSDEVEDESEKEETSSRRSKRQVSPQKNTKGKKIDSEDEDDDTKVSSNRFEKRNEKKKSDKHIRESNSETEEESSNKRSSRQKSKGDGSNESSLYKKNEKEKKDKDIESDSETEEESSNKRPIRQKSKGDGSEEKSADKKNDKRKKSKDIESDSETEDESSNTTHTRQKSKSDGSKEKSADKKNEKMKIDIESDSGTEEESSNKKSKRQKSKGDDSKQKDNDKKCKSNISKSKVKEDKSENNSVPDLSDLSSGSESDDSDSSPDSGEEFGKRKKKKKPTVKSPAEKKKTLRGKSKRTTGSKVKQDSDDEDENSDSDSSSFDPDLEKEIKSLSKSTKLTRSRTTRGSAKKEEEIDEEEDEKTEEESQVKSKESKKDKLKKGKKNDNIDDLSSGTDEDRPPDNEDEDDENDEEEDLSPSQIRKLRDARKAAEEDSDYEDMNQEDDSDDSSDPEVSFPKLKAPKKGKKKDSEDMSEDSDFVPAKKKKLKDKLLDAKISDSDDSDVGKKGKGKKGKGGKKRKRKKSESEPDPDDETYSDDGKKKGKGKKRRRIRKIDSSGEEGENVKDPGEDDNVSGSGDDDEEGGPGYLKRKKIRKVQTNKKLKDETKQARKEEEARRKRIEERQKEYNSYVEIEGGESEEELPEGTERELGEDEASVDTISKILGSPKKVPVTTKCILELDKEKKKPLVEIERTLVRKLKPHQVEACRFMYNCLVETISRLKEEGAGCILAHCMGLGKTLSVISFVHTMLRNVKHTKMTKCLVVCPLNTVLNWVNEFEIWLGDVDYEIEVYELSKVKANFERAQMLKEWSESDAGVMILGYDMYRNLVLGNHCKNKKQKKIFYETLCEPGPDLIICDEGHILKNDQTSLSKAMCKIKSRRRVVLTGTPLQNNLGEYHCMISFVKPNLLGTRKEFYNRFANPITNGQCKDSTPSDVKLMKRRAHILHELLDGCVQRKDYSALTKFLPPKFEYVISVRLSKVQMSLYQKYLETQGLFAEGEGGAKHKGGRLFKDYQALMRIWTHPWVMKLDEIRQENKRPFDDSEDSFVDDDEDSEMDSFIDDSTSSNSDSDASNKKKKKKKSKKGKDRKRAGNGSNSSSNSSDDESNKKDEDGNEVVKKWTSRRRGNEEGAGSSWMDVDMGYAPGGPQEVTTEWWNEFVKEGDDAKVELSGKLMLLFEILKMCEDIGDKVLLFSQSLLSLDIIEDFLEKIDEANQKHQAENKEEGDKKKDEDGSGDKKDEKKETKNDGDGKEDGDKVNGDKKEEIELTQFGKSWTKGADYFRMDGSTNSQNRKASQDMFNDPENYRSRLFLISTKAGSLGINLVAANRVIIFDASWNPSHDIQSIFRVYRFGQVKPVYVYRFLAQGTMEEKIYERQVTKQSLSQRVVDEHQIERHFTANDLQELYKFTPDSLDDPNRTERPLPMLPKDHMLAEMMTKQKDWIVTFHEHDSLLENVIDQELSEEEKKAAWEDYENEKKGIVQHAYGTPYGNPGMYANPNLSLQNLMLHGQANLGQAAVLQIVQDLKARFPNLPPEVFQQRVQAVLRQVLTQQIMQQSEMQRRQIDQQKMNEINRLNAIKQQIQRQQAMISNQQRGLGMQGMVPGASYPGGMNMGGASNMVTAYQNAPRMNSLLSMSQQLQNMRNSSPTMGQQGQNKK